MTIVSVSLWQINEDDRLINSLFWIQENHAFFRYRRYTDVMVILTNAGPNSEAREFYDELTNYIVANEYDDMEFVIVHQALPNQNADVRMAYDGIPNLTVVAVVGGNWPPTRLEIATTNAGTPENPKVVVDTTDTWWQEWVGTPEEEP